jgi:hypothetical protein
LNGIAMSSIAPSLVLGEFQKENLVAQAQYLGFSNIPSHYMRLIVYILLFSLSQPNWTWKVYLWFCDSICFLDFSVVINFEIKLKLHKITVIVEEVN